MFIFKGLRVLRRGGRYFYVLLKKPYILVLFIYMKISIKIKIFAFILLSFCFIQPVFSATQDKLQKDEQIDIRREGISNTAAIGPTEDVNENQLLPANNTARAIITEVIKEKKVVDDNGHETIQQDLKMKIITGGLTGREVEYNGISDIIVTDTKVYSPGDKVIVSYGAGEDGKNIFYITDFVRSGSLVWLLLVFVFAIFLVGKRKGLRAIASLGLTFLFITKIMAPLMLKGINPLWVGLAGSLVILLLIIYLTDGFNRKSHVAVVSIFFSLVATAILAIFFANLSRLTGLSDEEVAYLINAGKNIDFKNLLLAAIILGTLGIMDDVVVGQVEAVQQIKETDANLKPKEVYSRAMRVGRSHLGAVINTLFLAYAGAALPLLLLINLNQAPFVSFFDIVNSEQIATEIVRTLVGIIGLAMALPISTLMASFLIKTRVRK